MVTPPVRVHTYKSWPDSFEPVLTGRKRYEWRRHDDAREEVLVGDLPLLLEWNPHTSEYTGRVALAEVVHITRGGTYGLHDGAFVMGIEVVLVRAEPAS